MMVEACALSVCVLLLVGLAWYPCCGGGACSLCTGDVPATRTVTLANFTNDTCDNCDDLNASHVLAFQGPGGDYPCNWLKEGTSTCNGSTYDYTIRLRLNLQVGGAFWACDLDYGIGESERILVSYLLDKGPALTVSCTESLSLAYHITTLDNGACDNLTSTTCNVAAA